MWGHDVIRVQGLEFYAYHGVLPEENALGQRFIIDLDLFLDLRKAGRTDRVEDTINYAEVCAAVRKIVEGECCALLERLAEKIAQEILVNFPCQAVKVVVHKPQAPVPALFRDVSVEIWRERENAGLFKYGK